MYEALLNAIVEKARAINWPIQPAATPNELDDLAKRSQEALGCEPPDEYVAFLRHINGLDWNGLVIYTSHRSKLAEAPTKLIEGFVEGNLNYRDFEPMRGHLVFADDGTALYVQNLLNGRYEVILKVGTTVLQSYESFSALLFDALKASWPFPLPEAARREKGTRINSCTSP